MVIELREKLDVSLKFYSRLKWCVWSDFSRAHALFEGVFTNASL